MFVVVNFEIDGVVDGKVGACCVYLKKFKVVSVFGIEEGRGRKVVKEVREIKGLGKKFIESFIIF